MRYFKKGTEPACLVAARKKPGATYGNLSTPCKNEIRARLLRDQGWLCCYCMQRVEDDWGAMKIEHRESQSTSAARQLDWTNLLGACLGGEGFDPAEQHCDTRKGGRNISLDPTSSRTSQLIHYTNDGRVVSDDETVTNELTDVLGLNSTVFCRNRRAVMDGVIQAMNKRKQGAWTASDLERRIIDVETPRDERLPEYAGVIVAWLRQRLLRVAAKPTTTVPAKKHPSSQRRRPTGRK